MAASPLLFWFLVVAMTAVALAFVLPRLLSRRPPPAGASRAALNAEVYRGQLADLAREHAGGNLAAGDYERARADIERRLLDDVHEEAVATPGDRAGGRALAVAVALVLPAAALGLYLLVGTPGAINLGPDDAGAATAGGDPAAFAAQLDAHLARNPRDGRAWVARGRLDFTADRFAAAALAYEKGLAAAPKVARDPEVWCELADALGMAQGGSLAGRPTELIDRALALDPAHPKALEMAGSAAYERRDFRAAARHWRVLLERYATGSPEHREIAAAIERAERLGATMLPPDPAAPRARGNL